jgi:hypothetical protein
MAEIYRVELASPLSFPADQRTRAGVVVTKQDGYEGELSDEQLEAIKADEHLVVTKVAAKKNASTK